MFDCEDFEQGITHPVPSYKGLEYCLELLGLYRSLQTNTNPKNKTSTPYLTWLENPILKFMQCSSIKLGLFF